MALAPVLVKGFVIHPLHMIVQTEAFTEYLVFDFFLWIWLCSHLADLHWVQILANIWIFTNIHKYLNIHQILNWYLVFICDKILTCPQIIIFSKFVKYEYVGNI